MAKFAPKNGNSGHVNISGEGDALPEGAVIMFGNIPAASVEYVNPRLIRVGIPTSGIQGVVTLKINNEVLGGFTFGPPLKGLQLQDAFIPTTGGALELLGNGFTESGRDNSPTMTLNSRPYAGTTMDNSLIVVNGIPIGQVNTSYPITVAFSDGATATSTMTYVD